ncbi:MULTISPECIES: acyl-CoA carboxylase subunit beta [Streptomyces]|uniref:acyl-CoA carboxylase subunit beta n=1 Tax=Streptomyces TaxID=1883 RepID=UPI00224913C4|nr:acyl-CoA carboxylase subunit beta [Streptomyces sp. JHD 1]MCX2970488.1 acyl-CoA carboxylase subunit beta [Streptomyces sp. JHD 1]
MTPGTDPDPHDGYADAPGPAERLADWARREEEAVRRADARAAVRQGRKGKLTARQRIALLADPGSFTETDRLARHPSTGYRPEEAAPYGDGVVTGHLTVDGRPVCVFSQDFTVFGGSLGEASGQKVLKLMDLAQRIGCPVVGINDSGGARIQEGVVSLAHYAELARRNANASGVIPQVSLVLGPCAGGAVYTPALTDFTVMVEGVSHMFVTGPDVVRTVTGEETTPDDLGGPELNSRVTGTAHHLAADEEDAVDWVRDLLGYLPANNLEPPPRYATGPGSAPDATHLDHLVPGAPNQGYDMRDVLRAVVDDGELLQIQPLFAPNMICALARVEGSTVGVVANQPLHQAGTIDIDASEKAARFVRFCDAFNLPVLTFADVPGYLPGLAQERGGIIRRGAKLLYAYSEATVPTVTVVVRKAYGGGYAVMGSKHLGCDVNLAWPTAQIAVMGAAGAVGLLHRAELAERPEPSRAELRRKLIAEYERTLATPYVAAERGYVDAVIRPSETRHHVAGALRLLANKRQSPPQRKHSNMPL